MSKTIVNADEVVPTESLPVEVHQDAMISMIERIVMNPEIPMDRLEKMLELRNQEEDRNAEKAFALAMVCSQAEMRPISADAINPQTKSKYASYAQLDGVLRPIYTSHGLSVSYDEGDAKKEDYIRVLAYVSHKGGCTRTYRKDMPIVSTGIKGNPMMTQTHANASADSYGMRYLLKKIFNVAVGEFDDDGNKAGEAAVDTLSDEQQATIQDLLAEHGADKVKFLRWAKVSKISEINAGAYKSVIAMIKRKSA